MTGEGPDNSSVGGERGESRRKRLTADRDRLPSVEGAVPVWLLADFCPESPRCILLFKHSEGSNAIGAPAERESRLQKFPSVLTANLHFPMPRRRWGPRSRRCHGPDAPRARPHDPGLSLSRASNAATSSCVGLWLAAVATTERADPTAAAARPSGRLLDGVSAASRMCSVTLETRRPANQRWYDMAVPSHRGGSGPPCWGANRPATRRHSLALRVVARRLSPPPTHLPETFLEPAKLHV